MFMLITTTGNTIDILASDRQEGLPVDYKTPFSIAAGLEYRLSDETLVHFTGGMVCTTFNIRCYAA